MKSEGQVLGEEGAQRAADHADRSVDGWSDQAYLHATMFISLPISGAEFMSEQIRTFAESQGLIPAPDPRAWGAVILRLKRDGLIQFVGYAPSHKKTAHARPQTVWRAKKYEWE